MSDISDDQLRKILSPEEVGNMYLDEPKDQNVMRDAANYRRMIARVQELTDEIIDERSRQMMKWPDCESLPDGTGGAGRGTYETIAKNSCDRAHREGRLTHAHVFEEECMEVLAATEPAKIRTELVQVMAVAAKWIADIDSRTK